MFTGIIEEVGNIKKLPSNTNGKIIVAAKKILTDVKIGDSIAVNGICLTVTDYSTEYFSADVMPETLRRTSLTNLPSGAPVNLERALKPDSRLGGHIVSGHIDGAGKIVAVKEEGNAVLLTVECDAKLMRHIAEKGSVALDGISLTIAAATEKKFIVSLIPQTIGETNLHAKKIGDLINIETDILAKYVEKLLRTDAPNRCDTGDTLTENFLRENGF